MREQPRLLPVHVDVVARVEGIKIDEPDPLHPASRVGHRPVDLGFVVPGMGIVDEELCHDAAVSDGGRGVRWATGARLHARGRQRKGESVPGKAEGAKEGGAVDFEMVRVWR